MVSGPAEIAPSKAIKQRNNLSIIAHRGFAGVCPENTLAAMRGALSAGSAPKSDDPNDKAGGVDAIEIDVLPAADGEPVVFHDLTLGRLTDAPANLRRQPVWETSVETLREFSVLNSGESIPLLTEVMGAIPAEVGVNIELKHSGTGQPRRELDTRERDRGRKRWLAFIERVVGILAKYDNDFVISSSYEGALAAVRYVAPEFPLAYLFWNSIKNGLEITRRYDCEAVGPALDMVTGTALFNSGYTPTGPFAALDIVERAHEEDRAVNVWTVTTWHQAAQLCAAGVDGLVADYPGLLSYDSSRPLKTGKPVDQLSMSTLTQTDAAPSD